METFFVLPVPEGIAGEEKEFNKEKRKTEEREKQKTEPSETFWVALFPHWVRCWVRCFLFYVASTRIASKSAAAWEMRLDLELLLGGVLAVLPCVPVDAEAAAAEKVRMQGRQFVIELSFNERLACNRRSFARRRARDSMVKRGGNEK